MHFLAFASDILRVSGSSLLTVKWQVSSTRCEDVMKAGPRVVKGTKRREARRKTRSRLYGCEAKQLEEGARSDRGCASFNGLTNLFFDLNHWIDGPI